MKMLDRVSYKLGSRQEGENINNLRFADDTTKGRKLRGAKEPLDEGERGE